jgi:predicted deacylase
LERDNCMPETITIGNIEAKKGEKKSAFLKIGETPSGTLDLPLTIINGVREGPTLCLTAGTHPCEYTGIAAVIRVCKETKPEQLSGAVLGIPVLNMAGFTSRTPYVNPIDNMNLLSAFPGRSNGTMSHRIMHVFSQDILKKSNFRIDCHGGDYDERLNPNTYFSKIGDKKHDETAEILARIYGFRYVIQTPPHLTTTVVPSIIAECGGIKVLMESDIAQHADGIRNVMKFFKMLEGRPRIKVKQLFVKEFSYVSAEKGGLFYPMVEIGDKVKKNQKIGEIWNVWGNVIETLTSPTDGIVRKMFNNHATNSGDVLIQIMQSPEPLPPFEQTDQFIDLQEYDQTTRVPI